MIRHLTIRDLVVIAGGALDPGPGLTAITGETGAGKTVLAQALGLLAGAPADARSVRPGARAAIIEATLTLPPGFWDDVDDDDPVLALRELAESDDEIVVGRRIPAEGRARAMVDGQSAPRDAVAGLVAMLIRFSGQHSQRRLLGSAHQLAILDGFAGDEAVTGARRVAALRRSVRSLDREIASAAQMRANAAATRDELTALLAAVDALEPVDGEWDQLRERRVQLQHSERIVRGLDAACDAINAPEGGGAVDAVGAAIGALDALADVMPNLGDIAARIRATQETLQETLHELRAVMEGLDANPGESDTIEERLSEYQHIERRFSVPPDEILARAESARAALTAVEAGADADALLVAERGRVVAEALDAASALHDLRVDAARRLGDAIGIELAALAMTDARLRVDLDASADATGIPIDRATMYLKANPGLPESPLAETGSGGELSRVMLALQSVASAETPHATWVFDEVDAGIGGVTAGAVAEKLAALAAGRQVIVITHLPQVAARADHHYRLVKGRDADGAAQTTIEPVEGDALVDEICRMLGAGSDDAGARRHAEELLARRSLAEPKRGRTRR